MSNEQLTPLYDKKEVCPFCETPFTTKKIRSRFIKIDHTDTDFCPYYKDEEVSPLLYFVKVCHSCGYSYSDQFSGHFPEGTKESILQSVAIKWVPQNFGDERTIAKATQTYKLAYYCATLKKEKPIAIANLLIRLTWLYRKMEKEQDEKRFMELALQYFDAAYLDADYSNTEMTEIRVLYLLGELNRRLGNFDKAVTYYAKVVDQQNRTLERKVVDLAREQWFTTRDLMKQMQTEETEESEKTEEPNEPTQ